jgi:hypothetical protein
MKENINQKKTREGENPGEFFFFQYSLKVPKILGKIRVEF